MFDISTTSLGELSNKITIGILSTISLFVIKKLWDAIFSPLFLTKSFSITGVWIGVCKMPRYESIEVYRIVERKGKISFSFFSFRSDSSEVKRFVGSGIFRAQFLSAYYYAPKSGDHVSGVLSLQFSAGDLWGAFTQYTKNNSQLPKPEEFNLTRIMISRFSQIRMIARLTPFQTYAMAKDAIPDAHVGQKATA